MSESSKSQNLVHFFNDLPARIDWPRESTNSRRDLIILNFPLFNLKITPTWPLPTHVTSAHDAWCVGTQVYNTDTLHVSQQHLQRANSHFICRTNPYWSLWDFVPCQKTPVGFNSMFALLGGSHKWRYPIYHPFYLRMFHFWQDFHYKQSGYWDINYWFIIHYNPL